MIIGIVGNKNVGKDTLADYLVKKMGFIKYAFADPLKEGLKELFGLTDEQLYGDEKEIYDPIWETTPRELLQFFGTEVMQFKIQELLPNLKRTFFLKRFQQFVELNKYENIVVSDIRFQHELDQILTYQGIVIKIIREDASQTFLNHLSESEIDNLKNVTYNVENNSTVDDLYKKIIPIIRFNLLKSSKNDKV